MVRNEKVGDLKEYLGANGVEFKFHEFEGSTLTVEDSSERLGVDPERIVKSLVFMDGEDNPLLVVVSGVDRVDEAKLSKFHGGEIRMAKAREVEDYTGYKIGEVPPVGLGLCTFLDEKVTKFDSVIAGGGSTHTLVELDPEGILRLTNADVVKVS